DVGTMRCTRLATPVWYEAFGTCMLWCIRPGASRKSGLVDAAHHRSHLKDAPIWILTRTRRILSSRISLVAQAIYPLIRVRFCIARSRAFVRAVSLWMRMAQP